MRRNRANDAVRPPTADELVAQLELPEPFDLNELLHRLGKQRGRPIVVSAEPNLGDPEDGICGLWVELRDTDHLFIRAGLAPLHWEAAVLHEVGHMLYDHGGPADAYAPLLPALAGSGALHVHRVHARSRYEDPAEREAEEFARTVLAQARSFSPGPLRAAQPTTPVAVADVLDRLGAMFDAADPKETG